MYKLSIFCHTTVGYNTFLQCTHAISTATTAVAVINLLAIQYCDALCFRSAKSGAMPVLQSN